MAEPSIVVSGPWALPAHLIRDAVGQVLSGEGRDASISVTFVGRLAMQRMNLRHMGVDRPTDVIAFALPQPGGALVGDIYVCRPQAVAEARERGIPAREELLRLVVHGTLHVLGWEHPEDESRMRSPMWRRQERYLKGLK
jgi:probable rRNA maturation factor